MMKQISSGDLDQADDTYTSLKVNIEIHHLFQVLC